MISVIVPCFNEEEAIPLFAEMEKRKKKIAHDFEYIFINDGSKDGTLEVLRELARKHKTVRYISFSRNFWERGCFIRWTASV